MTTDGRVLDRTTGHAHDLGEAIARLPWRWQGGKKKLENFDPLKTIPLHQYVVRRDCAPEPYEILAYAVAKHPESFRGYFRGYQVPFRYLVIGDFRYWATAIRGTEMLNRSTHDSTEPPRRVDEGARPICWQRWKADWITLPQGTGWSEEFRQEYPHWFDRTRVPECADGRIAAGDRVKHLSSRRYGTVESVDDAAKTAWVRWDEGRSSTVGWKGLRTQCCLPDEPLGEAPPPGRTATPPRPAAHQPPAATGGRASDLHGEFWAQFARYLETKGSPARIERPVGKAIAPVPLGPDRFRIVPWNGIQGRESGVWVRWDGPEAQTVRERIAVEKRDEVEEALAAIGTVVWLDDDGKGSLLSLRRPSDLTNRATWPELQAWLAGAMETLSAVLRPYSPL